MPNAQRHSAAPFHSRTYQVRVPACYSISIAAALIRHVFEHSGALCNILVGFIAPKVPTQWILTVGVFVTGLSLLLFAVMPVGASYWGYTFFAMVGRSQEREARILTSSMIQS